MLRPTDRLTLAALALAAAGPATAQPAKPKVTQAPRFVEYDTRAWQPCEGLPGCAFVALRGDPKIGPSQWVFRLKAGTAFPRHWHSTPENVVGVRGALVFNFQTGDTRTLRAGDFLSYQAGTTHWGRCLAGQDCVYYVFNDGPYDITVLP